MPWKLNLLTLSDEEIAQNHPNNYNVGDCWYAPWLVHHAGMGQNYIDVLGTRSPIEIVLPRGWIWSPDKMAYTQALKYHGRGWAVTGKLPDINVTPSINMIEYHGYVTNGYVTEDCEGKKFSPDGLTRIN